MHIIDIITISLKNLWKRKFRTFLTTFAVIIGALLISLVFSIVNGVERFFSIQMETFSDPRFIEIHSQKFDFGEMFVSIGLGGEEPTEVQEGEASLFMPKPFKDEQIEKIREIDGIEQLIELTNPSAKSISLEGDEKKYQIYLMAIPKFMQETVDLVAGRYVEDDEMGEIVVASQYLNAWGIENAEDIIGKKVILEVEQEGGTICPPGCQSSNPDFKEPEKREYEFEIVGVSERTVLSTLVAISPQQALEIEKFRRNTEEILTDNDSSRFVAMALVESVGKVKDVEKAIEDLGHNAQTYEEQKNQLGQIFDILKYFLSTFGVIAMVVASLGIVNTLFMAIYERTREIGVMKAVGARSLNILILFLVEAALIGAIGGFVGMFLGLGFASLVNGVLHGAANYIEFGVLGSIFGLMLGFFISKLVPWFSRSRFRTSFVIFLMLFVWLLIGVGVAFFLNWAFDGGADSIESIAILRPYETLNISSLSIDLLIAPVLSTIVATVAGLIPAWRASKLSPVEALRYE